MRTRTLSELRNLIRAQLLKETAPADHRKCELCGGVLNSYDGSCAFCDTDDEWDDDGYTKGNFNELWPQVEAFIYEREDSHDLPGFLRDLGLRTEDCYELFSACHKAMEEYGLARAETNKMRRTIHGRRGDDFVSQAKQTLRDLLTNSADSALH